MKSTDIRRMCISAVCLALCLFLPFLTGQIPQIGSALSPMHIPVLLCGFVCGWPYGAVIGFIAPFLRYIIFGMPPMPGCVAMMFELFTYGIVSGIAYKLLPKKIPYLYVSLISAMLAGRIVWGVARFLIAKATNVSFSMKMFMEGAFITAIPGIICHILLIPPLVLALRRAGLSTTDGDTRAKCRCKEGIAG